MINLFDPVIFDVLIFDSEEPNGNIGNETEWYAEVLVPMGPVIRNEYKRFKFFDSNGNSYHRPPREEYEFEYGD